MVVLYSNKTAILFFVLAFLTATPVISSFLTSANKNHQKDIDHAILKKMTKPATFASSLELRGDSQNKGQQAAALEQFAPAASKLFSNMITPASILCGGIVPLCFASVLNIEGPAGESKYRQFLRKVFPMVATATLASLLVAIMCSSVTVNQLTENKPAMAASVWDLIQRDYKLNWAAVNSHFVFGMLGFMWLVGTKALFNGGGGAAFTLALSGMTAMVSIVNRGVARGGGKVGQRFGTSILGLFYCYFTLLWSHIRNSFGPMEFVAVSLFIGSVVAYGKYVWKELQ